MEIQWYVIRDCFPNFIYRDHAGLRMETRKDMYKRLPHRYFVVILGHLDGFSDPMVDCKETKLRFRADQLFYSPVILKDSGETIGYVCVQEGNDEDMVKDAKAQTKAMLKAKDLKGEVEAYSFKVLVDATED